MDGTICSFRRNSGCSAERKTLGIPFRTIPWRKKMHGILYSGTKIEANPRNSVPNHSAEEKNSRNSVLWNKKSKLSEDRLLRHGQIIMLSYFGCFLKQIFSVYLGSVPFGIDSSENLGMTQNERFLRSG